jgi:5S rRNA maturation endonuclease (ribonuclease M5)
LSTKLQEKEEALLRILQCLAEESAKGTPTVVEGKKDTETLRTLGIEGPIIPAKSGGKTFQDLLSEIEQTKARKVILLLDFDKRGKEWISRLKQHLERARITPDSTFWAQLIGLVGRDIKDIESLASYMETLKSKSRNS